MSTNYGFGMDLNVSYDEAISLVKDALKVEGFGVLTEIDVRRTLHDKIGVELAPYVILGACNPSLAYQALEENMAIGLLLPCNVVVRASPTGSRVDIADPQTMLGIVGDTRLDAIAAEARARLQRVADTLAAKAPVRP